MARQMGFGLAQGSVSDQLKTAVSDQLKTVSDQLKTAVSDQQ